jgi:tetratricopeptide (TPR) repeat protein
MNEEKLSVAQALELAVKKHKEGKLDEAELLYRQILKEYPNTPDALHLLGVVAHQSGRHEEAIKNISKAIKLRPNTAIYHGNLGMAYDALGKEEESTMSFERALSIDPRYGTAHLAHYNLGVYYKDRGNIKEALEHYDRAIELEGNFFDSRWNRSLILLLLERFKEGWEDYECRFKKQSPTDSRDFKKPKWDGSSLKGKRILIVSEQGFGDNIQFIRYVPMVKEKGGYVILESRKELRKLFEGVSGIDEFVEKQDALDVDFDFYIHLMSLPRIFNTTLDNIPNKIPYLKADPEKVEGFKEKLKNGFRVGIAWAGNPKQDNDKNRSATFKDFEILKNIPGVKLFSLQKGEAAKQLNDSEVVDFKDYIRDFSDTAAIIGSLDLVISVDTCVAHLAGAMGKPIWTVLTFTPDWRWLLDRTDNPWYPGMKLFRQPRFRDWDSVFSEVSKELRRIVP